MLGLLKATLVEVEAVPPNMPVLLKPPSLPDTGTPPKLKPPLLGVVSESSLALLAMGSLKSKIGLVVEAGRDSAARPASSAGGVKDEAFRPVF